MHPCRRVISIASILAAIHLSAPVATAQSDLLAKATRYVLEMLPSLTNIVAEETYVQKITNPSRKRELVSDYLLVRVAETREWTGFRDVFSVDGKPVRDRENRLMKLFVDSPATAFQQASNIAREGARHNLSNIGTINDPLLTLAFLQAEYSPRFRFLATRLDKNVGPDVWSIQYQEFVSPTVLKGDANRDIPARGRFWVEGATGRIVKTELLLGTDSVRSGLMPIQIVTTYTFDPDLMLNVPSKMEEWYPNRDGVASGVATYGRFRKFGVKVDEAIK